MNRPLPLLLAAAVLVTGLTGCTPGESGADAGTAARAREARWAEYIAEHSGGLIASRSEVRVRFVADVIDEKQLAAPPDDLLTIEPETPHRLRFDNPRELILSFEKPLPSGTRYAITLKRKALAGIPETLGDYRFTVDVIPQSLSLAEATLETDAGNSNAYRVQGAMRSADFAEITKLDGALALRVGERKVGLNWSASPDGLAHHFISEPIERLDEEQRATLSWNGSPLGTRDSGSRELIVPAKGVFSVTQMLPEFGERPTIHIDFSEELNTRQNLKGLYTVSGTEATYRIDGNRLSLFLANNQSQTVTVELSENIRSTDGRKLQAGTRQTVVFESQKPWVKFVGSGTLLPDAEKISLPFEALNVASVDVTAFRVFDSNLGQFLQVNGFDGTRELKRVGRSLWRKRITLDNVQINKSDRFAIDVSDLFRREPGALYRFTLEINRGQVLYPCAAADRAVPIPDPSPLANGDQFEETEQSGWDFAESEYDENGYRHYADRDNPCKDSYYRYNGSARSSRNFLAANIGLVVKLGENGVFHIATTNIRSGEPLGGAEVELFNYQNQSLKKITTDSDGLGAFHGDVRPFYAVARSGSQRGFLKLSPGLALPVSHFDVGGAKSRAGVKGAIYGERGVWRPGDTLYLTFVLDDAEKALPAGHPATLELISPKGLVQYSKTNTQPVDSFYPFAIKTLDSAETGNWRARVRIGNHEFERALKIETVMPNRLKVELRTPETIKLADQKPLTLFSEWLHGATAAGLKASVAVRLSPKTTRFTRGEGFAFDDPTREYSGAEQTLFDGELNDQGEADFTPKITADGNKSGMLSAEFTSRVFEPGGAFSVATQTASVHPFAHYVGIRLPKGDPARNMLLTDKKHKVEILSLDADGEPAALDNVEMTVHKLEWRWWWEQNASGVTSFEQANNHRNIASETIKTRKGEGRWEFEIKYPDWGRYLVRACDRDGGHCAAQVVYIDWPGWAGRAQEQTGPGANALTLYSDRKNYRVGETATVHLPPASKGRALLSIETGSRVLQQRWLQLDGQRSTAEIPITTGMAPNVYVSVTLLQAHQGKANDRPIRVYGVLPLLVEDPATLLQPTLEVPAEVRPESSFEVTVGESGGKAMTYTLAVVDDGLLGLTNYRVPRLQSEFYQREALGVRTWDMFDHVIGAYGAELERLLALGGSDAGGGEEAKRERKRFPPVVRYYGPFRLAAGDKARHQVTLPPYVGSVRAMVVAGKGGAYGSAEKSLQVRQPLMVQATLPRVLGPGETVRAPVSVFVMDAGISSVTLRAETDKLISRASDDPVRIAFKQTGDQLGFIELKVGDRLGKSRVRFVAESGKERAEQVIDIEVRAANPVTSVSQRMTLKAGEKQTVSLTRHGVPGSNQTTIEVSSIPPLNLAQRLDYLIQYPHGCVEQTTSGAFPQIYLGRLLDLAPEQARRASDNVARGIERLRQFQLTNGSFGYWPGHGGFHSWSTSYVGHFLTEAQRAGHAVPAHMLSEWRAFQQQRARAWLPAGREAGLDQAYRLYTLALAGQPELGAMNRLREQSGLPAATTWLLAASYKLAGIADVATKLARAAATAPETYRTEGSTFGSTLRDQAIMLEAARLLDDQARTQDLTESISRQLGTEGWHSTQTLSWSLLSLAHVVGDVRQGEIAVEWSVAGSKPVLDRSAKPILQIPLNAIGSQESPALALHNRGAGSAYVTVVNRGIAKAGTEKASAESLTIDVGFTSGAGEAVSVDALPQGQDIRAHVIVRNTSAVHLANLALTQVVPSGWEILNARMLVTGNAIEESPFDYRDVRDDRVHTYFDLKPGESKSFVQLFNVAYPGNYYLPSWNVEAMYDAKRNARNVGLWVKVRTQ